MIPLAAITEWTNNVPWTDMKQVEQDLILRAKNPAKIGAYKIQQISIIISVPLKLGRF